jgi:hypothetical protein
MGADAGVVAAGVETAVTRLKITVIIPRNKAGDGA